MRKISNSLLWIKNHKDLSLENIMEVLVKQSAIYRINFSRKSKGLIFIDYYPEVLSSEQIANDLRAQGLSARMIGM